MSTPIPDLSVERQAFANGAQRVAGMDEVGRGAWAGPVSVGVVMIESTVGPQPEKVRDSKAIAKSVREKLVPEITEWALDSAVGHASPSECDLFGMRAAIALASSRALDALGNVPDVVIVDGPLDLLAAESVEFNALVRNHRWRERPPRVEAIVKADQTCSSVSAASVIAKVTRDQMMGALAENFPPFDFEINVGYPSPQHQRALRGFGLTPLHRRSWRFVDSIPWLMGTGRPRPEPTR